MKKIALWLMLGFVFVGCVQKHVSIIYEGSPVVTDTFQARLTALATIPESDNLVLGFSDSLVMVWNPFKHQPVRKFSKHGHIINDVAISADGELLAIASGDKIFTVNELQSGKLIDSVDMLSGPATTLDFSQDKAFLAVGYGESKVQIWDVVNQERFAIFEEHWGVITKVKFRPGSHLLYSSATDSFLYITNVEGGDSSSCMKQLYGSLSAVAFSPDGRFCAMGGTDNLVNLWRIWPTGGNDTLTFLGWYQGGLDRIRDLCFSPTDSLIAAAYHGGQVVFLRVFQTPQNVKKRGIGGGVITVNLLELGRFKAHAGAVRACAFSPDGSKLYTGGDDELLKTWDVAQILAELKTKTEEPEK